MGGAAQRTYIERMADRPPDRVQETASDSSSDCLYDKRADGVALITLNRPDRRNAMSPTMQHLLIGFLEDCERDPQVRCVALTGAGDKAFCAGADIKRMSRGPGTQETGTPDRQEAGGRPAPTFEDKVRDLQRRQNGSVLKLHTMAKPTVALVNGFAVGAGFSFAMSCDMRVFGDRAQISTGYRNLAVGGDLGGPYFLSKMVGSGIARELLFTGEMIDAPRALSLGIANRVVPHDRLLEDGLAFCASIAQGPTRAFGRMKQTLLYVETHPLQEVLDTEAVTMQYALQNEDHFEAVRAFGEKRAPRFTGR